MGPGYHIGDTMNALFSPAVALLNRLRYPKKFMLLGLISLLVIGSLLVQLGAVAPGEHRFRGEGAGGAGARSPAAQGDPDRSAAPRFVLRPAQRQRGDARAAAEEDRRCGRRLQGGRRGPVRRAVEFGRQALAGGAQGLGRAGIHRPADEAAGQPARPHRDDPQGRAHPSRSGRRRQPDPRPFGRLLLPHRQPDPSGAGRVGAAGPPAGDGDRRARRQGHGRPAPLRHRAPSWAS